MQRIFAIALVGILAACGGEPEAEPAQESVTMTDADAPASVTNATATDGPIYVDVRTPEEFATGHVAGAINIPHDQMEQRWRELEDFQDQELVVYCRTGRRSGIAKEVLDQHDFNNVENGGGLDDLIAQGVETGE